MSDDKKSKKPSAKKRPRRAWGEVKQELSKAPQPLPPAPVLGGGAGVTASGPALPEYRAISRVRAIHVAEVDPKAGTIRDQDGTVWPIVDRRVTDSGAGPGDWLVVHENGFVVVVSDARFKGLYEPEGGWK